MYTLSIALILVLSCQLFHYSSQFTCTSLIYCEGNLLDTVQRAELFKDSKTFVYMMQIHSSKVTLKNFKKLKNKTKNKPTKEDIRKFVEDNFVGELQTWTPPDFNSNPKFLKEITNEIVRSFAQAQVNVWPMLGRKIEQDVFEQYYWDSYWIVKGLLISEMTDTARRMIDNLLFLVKRYGFAPNGNRVYYLNRSQPPLLTLMVGLYMDQSNDLRWLRRNVQIIDKELTWWLTNRTVTVEKHGSNYTLAHYNCLSGTPRPESYIGDIRTCKKFRRREDMENCYRDLTSGAESGWDFSSRWLFNSTGGIDGNLSDIQTRMVVPVDLNAILCRSFADLASFYLKVGHASKAVQWKKKEDEWKDAIVMVLYDIDDGIWYDYDIVLSQRRRGFYPSNFAPLWTKSYYSYNSMEFGKRAANYFKAYRLDTYPGGVPASLNETGEQWDFPNVWPPLQEIIILGLSESEDSEAMRLGKEFAVRWISANILGYKKTGKIFEKYDAITAGLYGGGRENSIQGGFGWTNGVALSLINKYYGPANIRKVKSRFSSITHP